MYQRPSREELQELLASYSSVREAADSIGVSYNTVYRWIHYHSLIEDNGKVISSMGLSSTDDVLLENGLDPDNHSVSNVRISKKETQKGTLASISVTVKPKPEAVDVFLVRPDGWKRPNLPRPKKKAKTTLHVVRADRHDPFKDPGLHSCFQQWLRENKPDRGWDLGDSMDLTSPSRHRTPLGRQYRATPGECLNACYNSWRDDIDSSPDTAWTTMPGNHDLRIEIVVRDKYKDLQDIPFRAGDSRPWYDLAAQLRFDELGIEYVRKDHEYFASKVQICDGLMVEHGTAFGPNGGAIKEATNLICDNMQGHDHKQSLNHSVKYDAAGCRYQYRHVSVGCMALPDLGYKDKPDAIQGFCTVVERRDGSYHIEFAEYDYESRRLWWRDQEYKAV